MICILRKRFKISFFSCVLPSQAEFFGSFNSFITAYGLFKKTNPKNMSEMGFVLKLSDMNLYCFDSMLISQHFLSVSSGIDYLICAKHLRSGDNCSGTNTVPVVK